MFAFDAEAGLAVLEDLGDGLHALEQGVDAVAKVRKIIGSTFPDQAPPGTIRGDFAHQTKASSEVSGKAVMNLVHASGNSEEAKYEVELWFDAAEQFDYQTLAEKFAY